MAAKWLIVLIALVATASAQTTMMMMPEATPAPTPMPTTEAPTTEGPTMGGMTGPVAQPNDTAGDRFNASQASETRGDHFYCLGFNNTREDFGAAATYRWGLWIQYPVLSYLDSMRKRHLLYVISRMAQISNFEDICIAEVEQYAVSTFRESVFMKLYIRGLDDIDRLAIYDMNFRSAFLDSSSPYVQRFLDRRALNINATEPSDGRPVLSGRTVNDSVHPGCNMVMCPEGDPTVLAIVLGTYYGPWNITRYGKGVDITVEDLMGGGLTNSTILQSFAENPRPINYGLEAGDIVFAVFGSIFLTILCGAIILGFVIHPFFLS